MPRKKVTCWCQKVTDPKWDILLEGSHNTSPLCLHEAPTQPRGITGMTGVIKGDIMGRGVLTAILEDSGG